MQNRHMLTIAMYCTKVSYPDTSIATSQSPEVTGVKQTKRFPCPPGQHFQWNGFKFVRNVDRAEGKQDAPV